MQGLVCKQASDDSASATPQTQDSAHFKNEARKQAAVSEKIARLQAKASALSAAELAGHTRAVDVKAAALEAARDLGRSWLHVDMDVRR